MTKVIHIKDKNKYTNTVYIGRGSIWGNPFVMQNQSMTERNRVIAEYKKYILATPKLLEQLHTLKGKTLVCYCKPLPCHGDVLIELINQL